VKVSRIHRLLKLITLLQTGDPYHAPDLATQLKVSKRTLFRDLNLLKMAGIPLIYDASARRYTIEQSFFLPPTNFTMPEVLGLMMVLRKYGSQTALPNFEAIVGAMTKIESTLPRDIQEYCGHAMNQIDVHHSPMTDVGRTTDTFETLWQGARLCESIDLTYDSYFDQKEIVTRLNPYRLMFISRGWYVIGYSSLHEEVRTFKVERVLASKPTDRHFRVDPDFDPATYFGNAWQMIRGDQRYRVRIQFSPKVGRNVEEVLWHPTQQVQFLDDQSMMYEVEVDGVNEIAWWVLGYGKEAVVKEPPELRDIIREHARAMLAAYDETPKQE